MSPRSPVKRAKAFSGACVFAVFVSVLEMGPGCAGRAGGDPSPPPCLCQSLQRKCFRGGPTYTLECIWMGAGWRDGGSRGCLEVTSVKRQSSMEGGNGDERGIQTG
jgi:hypothetical protein